jgi:predicted exporter
MGFADEQQPGNVFDKYPLLYKSTILLFLAYIVFLVVVAAGVLRQGIAVETDIQAIVPQNNDPAIQMANSILTERFGNLAIFAIAGSDRSGIKDCADALNREISRHEQVQVLDERALIASFQSLVEVYRPFRFVLLSGQDKAMLSDGHPETLVQSAWRSLLGFQSGNSVSGFADDPLRTFNNFYNDLPFMQGKTGIDSDGFVQIKHTDNTVSYVKPVVVEFNGKALDMSEQKEIVSFFRSVQVSIENNYPQLEIYRTGFIFHAENAASKAKREFTLISLVSIAGIILLLVFCFTSLRPLLLSISSLLFGFAAAGVICSFLFQKLHLLTLVFGASLIGVAVDYSLHYFSHMQSEENFPMSKLETLKRLLPSLLLGVVTTVAGYACLFQTSLPGLREIAAFCIIGLVSAWLFVVCVHPWLAARNESRFPLFIYNVALMPEKLWRVLGVGRSIGLVCLLFILSVSAWFVFGRTAHDIRLLYKPPAELVAQDIMIGGLFPEQASNQYFLVNGSDPQELLRNEELLTSELHRLIDSGELDGFSALSRYIPSVAVQKENYKLLANTLYSDRGELDSFALQAGTENEFPGSFKQSFKQAANLYLKPEELLTRIPGELAYLWLGEHDGLYYSIVSLTGIKSVQTLSGISDNNKDAIFVDRVQSLSDILKQQYGQAITLLVAGYILIGLIILLRYRSVGSLAIVAIPLISSFMLFALLTLFSVPVGLFHILALYLSLGLGLDYGIFLYDSPTSKETSVAVMLSALTSCLSFGMLSLSSTPMISAFGVTILVTGLMSLLLAPFLIKLGRDL